MLRKFILISILVALSAIIFYDYKQRNIKHPYLDLSVEEIVEKYNYPIETHEVITEDGYMLTLHRIPHRQKQTKKHPTPVLIIHGVLQSSWDFVIIEPEKSLTYLIANEGYDIWIGSVRGTIYSRKHQQLNPDTNSSYWDFTENEIATYDLPTFIDYVLEITKQDQLHYLGYSQGNMVFFMMGSEKPEYMKKIKSMIALAPAVFMKDPESPILNLLVNYRNIANKLSELIDWNDIYGRNSWLRKYLVFICNEQSILLKLCLFHTFNLFGPSPEEFRENLLSLTMAKTPSGVSRKQILQVFQMIDAGEFRKFDYGVEGNLQKYGQENPPDYNLSRVEAPVAIYYCQNDWIVNIKNIDRLIKSLPNVTRTYQVPSKQFNHNDFLYGKNVVKFVVQPVLEELAKY